MAMAAAMGSTTKVVEEGLAEEVRVASGGVVGWADKMEVEREATRAVGVAAMARRQQRSPCM